MCILLQGEGAEPSLRLRRALEKKGIRVVPCMDAYTALTRLARAARDREVSLPILVLEEPRRIEGKAALLGLASLYAPRAVFWMYTSEPPEQVREVRESDIEAWRQREALQEEPPEVHTRPVEAKRGPQLRIVPGEEPEPPAGSSGGAEPEEREGFRAGPDDLEDVGRRTKDGEGSGRDEEPLLTDEELSMLLDEPEDERNGGRR